MAEYGSDSSAVSSHHTVCSASSNQSRSPMRDCRICSKYSVQWKHLTLCWSEPSWSLWSHFSMQCTQNRAFNTSSQCHSDISIVCNWQNTSLLPLLTDAILTLQFRVCSHYQCHTVHTLLSVGAILHPLNDLQTVVLSNSSYVCNEECESLLLV